MEFWTLTFFALDENERFSQHLYISMQMSDASGNKERYSNPICEEHLTFNKIG